MGVVTTLADDVRSRATGRTSPLLVALDGRSGAGKSTLATAAAEAIRADGLDARVIDGDDFYAGGSPALWDMMSAAEKVANAMDWRRQRAVLDQLRRGHEARWRPFDWEAFDGRLASTQFRCPPAAVVVLEGAYSGRPELADLIDVRVLLDTTAPVRRQRLIAREGADYADDWFARWTEAEELYFGSVMPSSAFDLVLSG